MKMPHKIMLQALVPVIIVASVVALLMNYHSQRLTEGEIAAFQDRMLVAKRTMLSSYVSLAQASIRTLYEGKRAGDPAAKAMAVDVLNGLSIDPDAGFFVYDFNGKSLVHPRQPLQVGQNRLKMTGPNGQPVVQQFISRARAGGGFQPYAWRDPETDKVRDRISYVVALDKWGWVLGASVNVDDVIQQVRETEIDAVTRTRQNAVVIGVLTVKALIIVVVTGLVFGLHERREADAKLKQLTQRIVETQEEERGRVARELHDGISQILVSVKYALELAQLRAAGKSDEASDAIANGAKGLNTAIREVRRISRDLRPAILDDLGLSPALESLAAEFSERTGIEVEISTVAFQSTLPTDAKTTLFRVAQEALTNIE
ncbi:MAG: cache domain-containing protein, partial [Magnetovibrio sp.]|nr:cache domain-containing protein [Magnetovibrio sp.]